MIFPILLLCIFFYLVKERDAELKLMSKFIAATMKRITTTAKKTNNTSYIFDDDDDDDNNSNNSNNNERLYEKVISRYYVILWNSNRKILTHIILIRTNACNKKWFCYCRENKKVKYYMTDADAFTHISNFS